MQVSILIININTKYRDMQEDKLSNQRFFDQDFDSWGFEFQEPSNQESLGIQTRYQIQLSRQQMSMMQHMDQARSFPQQMHMLQRVDRCQQDQFYGQQAPSLQDMQENNYQLQLPGPQMPKFEDKNRPQISSKQNQGIFDAYKGQQMFLGSFATNSIANNCDLRFQNGQLKAQNRYYYIGKDPIRLSEQMMSILNKQKKNLKIDYSRKLERTQKKQKWLQSINFNSYNYKSNQISFNPMFINCWKLLINSKDVKVKFFTNISQKYEHGSLLVPLRIELKIEQSLLNQYSKLQGKGYVELIREYQNLKKAKNQCASIRKKLQNNPVNGVNYKGIRYFNFGQFQNVYHDHTNAFHYFKRTQVEEAKVTRLFLLYLMEKLKVKVIQRSFIKPRKRMNYFITWFINKTIGHKLSNTRKYNSNMKSFLLSDSLSLLVQKQEQFLNYYKSQLQSKQIKKMGDKIEEAVDNSMKEQKICTKESLEMQIQSDFEMCNQFSEKDQQAQIVKNWMKNEQQNYLHQIDQKKRCKILQFSCPEQQNLPEQLLNQRKNMEDKILEQLGLTKKQETTMNQQIQQQNAKLARQFERENKYFRIHPTPETMKNKLHNYQGQALQWMKYRQGKIKVTQLFQQTYLDEQEQNFQYQRNLSPFWSEIELLHGQRIYVNYVTGEFTKKFHRWKSIKGGILADQMGLGKTVMAISLLADDQFQGTNLIVVPVNVIKQWVSQFKKHCTRQLKIYEYHEDHNKRKVNILDYDIIITTYGTLGNEQKAFASVIQGQPRRPQQKFLFEYNFRRVILDEAQNIKSPVTLQFEGAYRLKSEFKWCLTGTVVQNTEQDLFSIFKFLDVEVFSDEYWWNTYIKRCDNQAEKFNILHTALRPILLRRTKQSTSLDGRVILTLPQKRQFVIRPEFTATEAQIYSELQKGIKIHLAQLTQKTNNSFTHIFQILSRLRQFCCHPSLIFKKRLQDIGQGDVKQFLQKFIKSGSDQFKIQAIETILQDQNVICPICQQEPREEAVITPCGHIYCQTCLKEMSSSNSGQKCAVCRKQLNGEYFRKSKKDGQNKQEINKMLESESSKVKAIIQTLCQIAKRKEKCVIFSQWVKIIQILKIRMNQLGMKWVIITGSMNKMARSKSVTQFKESQECSFMIVSLKAGGTGLNLTMANNVMVCDPWWNPAQQDQAVHRVHRIGQEKPVNVYRFYMKDSIEQKIQKMHDRKRKLADKVMMKSSRQPEKEEKATQEMIRMIVQ